jgi:hypothetical protein
LGLGVTLALCPVISSSRYLKTFFVVASYYWYLVKTNKDIMNSDDGRQVMAIAHTGELKITDWLILGYTDILYIKYNYE